MKINKSELSDKLLLIAFTISILFLIFVIITQIYSPYTEECEIKDGKIIETFINIYDSKWKVIERQKIRKFYIYFNFAGQLKQLAVAPADFYFYIKKGYIIYTEQKNFIEALIIEIKKEE